jgi:hypothetical protein
MNYSWPLAVIKYALLAGLCGCTRSSIPDPCGLPLEILPKGVRLSGRDVLVMPVWRVIPKLYTGAENLDCELRAPFLVANLELVPAGLKSPDSWGFGTPGARVGKNARILSGIYLMSDAGDAVWLRASVGVDFKWGYIKAGFLDNRWKNSLLTALATKEIRTKGEKEDNFFGADYGRSFKLKIVLNESEKKIVERFVEGVRVKAENSEGKWIRLTD